MRELKGDLLESANLALVIQLVVQGTLNSGVHGSGPLDSRVSGLAGHAAGTGTRERGAGWIDGSMSRDARAGPRTPKR
jgi:hypothetical protein